MCMTCDLKQPSLDVTIFLKKLIAWRIFRIVVLHKLLSSSSVWWYAQILRLPMTFSASEEVAYPLELSLTKTLCLYLMGTWSQESGPKSRKAALMDRRYAIVHYSMIITTWEEVRCDAFQRVYLEQTCETDTYIYSLISNPTRFSTILALISHSQLILSNA